MFRFVTVRFLIGNRLVLDLGLLIMSLTFLKWYRIWHVGDVLCTAGSLSRRQCCNGRHKGLILAGITLLLTIPLNFLLFFSPLFHTLLYQFLQPSSPFWLFFSPFPHLLFYLTLPLLFFQLFLSLFGTFSPYYFTPYCYNFSNISSHFLLFFPHLFFYNFGITSSTLFHSVHVLPTKECDYSPSFFKFFFFNYFLQL